MLHLLKNPTYNFSIRVRYAPSPTGPMHLGAVRTALFNYMLAKNNNGKFIVRIEDTDTERNVPGSQEQILDTLDWLGIRADQSVRVGGDYGPYVQSQRLGIYREVWEDLLRRNLAYRCFCESTNTPKKTKPQSSTNPNPEPQPYSRKCLHLTQPQLSHNLSLNLPFSIRLRSNLPQFSTPTFTDLLHGPIQSTPFDDFVLIKKNGYPTYHFANVVDDWKMGITHVVRGMEWLTNTPKHVYLYRVLGVKLPVFVHLPLIFSMEGKKLSKRDPTAPVANLKAMGYQPEAIINYVGLMGYNPNPQKPTQSTESPTSPQSQPSNQPQPTQYFTLPQLTTTFTLKSLKTSPIKSDIKKLNFFNRYYLRKKWKEQDQQFRQEVFQFFRKKFLLKKGMREDEEEYLGDVVDCVLERVDHLGEFGLFGYFFGRVEFGDGSLKDIKKMFGENTTIQQINGTKKLLNTTPSLLQKNKKILHNLLLIFTHILPPSSPSSPSPSPTTQQYSQQKIAQQISQFLYDNKDIKNEEVYHMLRLAVTGHKSGVNIVRTCWLLGRDRVQGDLRRVYEMLE